MDVRFSTGGALRVVCAVVVAGLLWTHGAASAQSATATLAVRVVDESGGAVSGVALTLVNVATSVQRLATSDDAGAATFTFVVPGRYSLQAARDGFGPGRSDGLVLNVGDVVALQVRLRVGAVTDAVTVVASPPVVNAAGSVSTVLDQALVTNLPINGRSFQSLIALAPGTVLTRVAGLESGQFSVNGQRANANYFMVDGVSANIAVPPPGSTPGQLASGTLPGLSRQGGTNSLVSVEAMQEFRMETSTYAAEYGRSPGAQVAIVTRAGGSKFQGSLFEYFRDEALDARDAFAVRRGLPEPALRQHQFGGVLGGPVRRAGAFFFASYEGLRLEQPQVRVSQVPSLSVRQAASPAMRPLLNQFPIPNGAALDDQSAEFAASYSDPSSLDASSLRVDRPFRAVNTFVRYAYAPSNSRRRGGNSGLQALNNLTIDELTTQTVTAGVTSPLFGTLLNDLRFNVSSNVAAGRYEVDDFGGGVPAAESALFPAFTSGAESTMQYRLGALTYLHGTQGRNRQRQLNIVNVVSAGAGAHQVKVGLDYRRLWLRLGPTAYFSNASFPTVTSSAAGVPSSLTVDANLASEPTFDNWSLFAQDTWSVHPRLTVTAGLRWERNTPPRAAADENALSLEGLDAPQTFAVAPRSAPLWEAGWGNLAPRLGVAYAVSRRSTRETVVRGGVGTFYDVGTSNAVRGFTGSGFLGQTVLSGRPFDGLTALGVPPAIQSGPPYSFVWGFDRNFSQPYTMQWNVGVEQVVGGSTISLAYVGARGRNLLQFQGYFRPNPTFSGLVLVNRNTGRSEYDGLQAQYRRRLHAGLQVLAAYTLGRSRDTASGDANFGLPPGVDDPGYDWGPSDFDARHVFTTALSYDVPAPAALGWLTRGWGIDAIFQARSALPVNVFTNGGALFGLARIRPSAVAGEPQTVDDPGAPGGLRYNRNAFALSSPLAPGALGRNALRGFAASQLDMAVRRGVGLPRGLQLQFRAEVFNVLNRANYGDPEGNLASALFGTSTQMLNQSLGGLSAAYQVGGPRSMQLSVRVSF